MNAVKANRKLIKLRAEIAECVEHCIQGTRNAPHSKLGKLLDEAQECNKIVLSKVYDSPMLINDQPILPMPKHCNRWPCHQYKEDLENVDGFMVCPICKYSYGAAE